MGHRPGLWLATKGRERSWWLLLVAVCGAVPAVVLAGFTDSPPWLEGLAGALGVASGLLVAELRARRLLDDTAASARRAHVAGALDELPRVENVDLGYAGVHPALVEVGYVARAAEAQVSDAVQKRGRVLIVGRAMSGKTRMAVHVAQTLFNDHRLFKPKDGAALHHLLSQGIKPSRLVVWLDRLDLFLGSAGLSVDDLRAFCEDGTVVIATVRLNAYEALLPHDGLQSVDCDVLERLGHPVVVDWADGELAHADVVLPAAVRDADDPRSGFIDLTSGTALMQKTFDGAHVAGLQWATALWEIRRSLGKLVLDPIVLTCWRRTAPTLDDRTAFAGRLSDLAASTPRPAATNVIGDVLARHHLPVLRSR